MPNAQPRGIGSEHWVHRWIAFSPRTVRANSQRNPVSGSRAIPNWSTPIVHKISFLDESNSLCILITLQLRKASESHPRDLKAYKAFKSWRLLQRNYSRATGSTSHLEPYFWGMSAISALSPRQGRPKRTSLKDRLSFLKMSKISLFCVTKKSFLQEGFF